MTKEAYSLYWKIREKACCICGQP